MLFKKTWTVQVVELPPKKNKKKYLSRKIIEDIFCVYNDDDNTTTTSFLMDLHESGADTNAANKTFKYRKYFLSCIKKERGVRR